MTWESAWREGRTRWDAGAPAPALVQLLREERLPGERVLVTGCGSGYDVFALAENGRAVTGIDVAPTAAERFERERAARSPLAGSARIVLADFFTWTPAQRFDLVWDYTFLCALPPTQRHRWGARMDALVKPEGHVATLIFPMVESDGSGPPFALFPDDVAAALPGWEPLFVEEPGASHPGREGKERVALWRRRQ